MVRVDRIRSKRHLYSLYFIVDGNSHFVVILNLQNMLEVIKIRMHFMPITNYRYLNQFEGLKHIS